MLLNWKFKPEKGVERMYNTAFQQVVSMDASSFLGRNGLNVIAACLVVLFALITLLRLHSRILGMMGVESMVEPQEGNLDHQETISDGRRALDRAFQRQQDHRGGGGGGGGGGSSGNYLPPRR